MTYPVAVVGAGIGGLAAAIHLAAAGRRVVIYERNAAVGGKMAEVRASGFRWDTGPSVVTMRPVLEDLFAAAGRRLDDCLDLVPVHPLTRYIYRDGRVLDAVTDLSAMAAAIAAIEPRDVEGYLAFLADAARIHRITSPVFIEGEPPSLASLRRASPLDALRIGSGRTLHAAVRRRVHSPHLRMLLDRFATYVGASPYHAPATLAVIAHVELTGGVWYPRGGVYRIAEALAAAASGMGVTIRTGCAVKEIVVRDGRAVGVRLPGGQFEPAAAVVANTDVTRTYADLLPPTPAVQRRLAVLAARETSCSGFVLLLGVEGTFPHLAHHTILFPQEYRREFEDIFVREMGSAYCRLLVLLCW
jgi:phytoene desaturase